METWVNEAALSGGKILWGGKRISDTLYEPTVILNPNALFNTAPITEHMYLDV